MCSLAASDSWYPCDFLATRREEVGSGSTAPAAILVRWQALGALVLVVPDHRFPELDLVSIRIHDPGELSVLVRLGSLDDVDTGRAQLLDHLDEVVDAVVDHEG